MEPTIKNFVPEMALFFMQEGVPAIFFSSNSEVIVLENPTDARAVAVQFLGRLLDKESNNQYISKNLRLSCRNAVLWLTNNED